MSNTPLLFPYIGTVIAALAQGLPLVLLLIYLLDRRGS